MIYAWSIQWKKRKYPNTKALFGTWNSMEYYEEWNSYFMLNTHSQLWFKFQMWKCYSIEFNSYSTILTLIENSIIEKLPQDGYFINLSNINSSWGIFILWPWNSLSIHTLLHSMSQIKSKSYSVKFCKNSIKYAKHLTIFTYGK